MTLPRQTWRIASSSSLLVNPIQRLTPDLHALIGLFYRAPDELGRFEEVLISKIPEPQRELLAHTHHMTVTLERFHGGPVDVRVLQKHVTATHYARKILLARQADGRVVQYGIMRINLSLLSAPVRAEIEAESTPLGRILIEHDVLRRIHLMSLWRIEPGRELRQVFGLTAPVDTYGRCAVIDCNDEPAVELLEIVSPA
jgi:chorismate-pyruvate lyase